MGTIGSATELFSGTLHAARYAAVRGTYPPILFQKILDFARFQAREHALDVATGSGQAAVELAKTFNKVIAIDGSAAQLANRIEECPNIIYAQALAEDIPRDVVPDRSVDLVTVAQALHWFDEELFLREVRRVLKPLSGTFTAWGYGIPKFIANGGNLNDEAATRANQALRHLHHGVLGVYWDARRLHVDRAYEGLEPGPEHFDVVQRELFDMVDDRMTLSRLISFLQSWGSYERYRRDHDGGEGHDPIDAFRTTINSLLPDNRQDDTISICTPYFMVLAKGPRPVQ